MAFLGAFWGVCLGLPDALFFNSNFCTGFIWSVVWFWLSSARLRYSRVATGVSGPSKKNLNFMLLHEIFCANFHVEVYVLFVLQETFFWPRRLSAACKRIGRMRPPDHFVALFVVPFCTNWPQTKMLAAGSKLWQSFCYKVWPPISTTSI